jgi:hypothetical protein
MVRALFALLIVSFAQITWAQQYSVSFGVYTGVTASYTADEGIKKDPRYEARFEAKYAPVGINVALDYEAFGVMLSPGFVHVGQNFYVINTFGGQDGLRQIDQQYLTVPLSLKFHLIRFSAFKFSALTSISPSFLLDGKEQLSHRATKLKFPEEVHSILPSAYTIEYDGVLAPEVSDLVIADKHDFRSVQIFVGAGFRTDWDPSNHWRISAELRMNYGLFDPRTGPSLQSKESSLQLYEVPGKRRDMYAQFTLGISRYIEFDKSEHDRKKRLKGTTRMYKPTQYPGNKPRQSKSKN